VAQQEAQHAAYMAAQEVGELEGVDVMGLGKGRA